jgi:hypothetical protein
MLPLKLPLQRLPYHLQHEVAAEVVDSEVTKEVS